MQREFQGVMLSHHGLPADACKCEHGAAWVLQALTKWGGALLELAHFRQGSDAYVTIGEVSSHVHALLTLDLFHDDYQHSSEYKGVTGSLQLSSSLPGEAS